jgi:hypothetical protein
MFRNIKLNPNISLLDHKIVLQQNNTNEQFRHKGWGVIPSRFFLKLKFEFYFRRFFSKRQIFSFCLKLRIISHLIMFTFNYINICLQHSE